VTAKVSNLCGQSVKWKRSACQIRRGISEHKCIPK